MTGVLGEGIQLMLAGMGVVFVLLTLLVLAVRGMSRLALAVGPPATAPDAPAAGGLDAGGTELVAVISAAVTAYRRDAR